jgi:hypothetical protein
MAVGFPVKDDYATGDVLTAANMNDFSGTVNTIAAPLGSAAGKNKLINGGFDIWQRGITFTGTGWAFSADRWAYLSLGGNSTVTQETTVVPVGFRYSTKFTAGATITGYLSQSIETFDTLQLAGKTVAFSAQVAATASIPLQLVVEFSTTVDASSGASWTGITATSGSTATPTTTTFIPISGVYAIPSTAKTVRAYVRTQSTITSGQAFYFAGAQLEIGSLPTAFAKAGGTIQGELAACQRYYQVATRNDVFNIGMCPSTSESKAAESFFNEMRVAPTIVLAAAGSGTNQISFLTSAGNYPATIGTITAAGITKSGFLYSGSGFTSGFTAGNASFLYANGTTEVWKASAEL